MDSGTLAFVVIVALLIIGAVWAKRGTRRPQPVVQPHTPTEPPDVRRGTLRQLAVGQITLAIEGCPVLLHGGERLVIACPGVQLCQERSINLGSSGVSFRVMRGFWVHSGGTQHELRVLPIDKGWLAVTTTRIAFVGSRRTLEFPLRTLTTIQGAGDGISLGKGSSGRLSYFVGFGAAKLSFSYGDGGAQHTSRALSGTDLREVVELLVNAPVADAPHKTHARAHRPAPHPELPSGGA